MASPEYLLCDGCGKHVPKEARSYFATDRVADAAGSSEDVGYTIELCSVCWPKALKGMGYEFAVKLKAWVDGKQSRGM